MFAFVDESGNTGANIFDENQPIFYSGAIATKNNFDIIHGQKLAQIAKSVGVASLHGRVLGIHRIEPISLSLLAVIKKARPRFMISRVEKKYLIVTKMFDHIFDSGENPAVLWTHYNHRILRLTLVFKLSVIVKKETAKKFWSCLLDRNQKRAYQTLSVVCAEILDNIARVPDARSREILAKGLMFVRDNPSVVDIHSESVFANNGHMPNIVAFFGLLDGLDMLSKKWESPVRTITHDQQAQFGETLREAHEWVKGLPPGSFRWAGENHSLQKVASSTFDLKSDDDSPGVQMADVILWLFTQVDRGRPLPPGCSKLLSEALKKALMNDFSFNGVHEQIYPQFSKIMNENMDQKSIEAGKNLQRHLEELSHRNMTQYIEDGLRPFERGLPEHPIRTAPSIKSSGSD